MEKERLTESLAQEIEARITRTTDLQALAQCDAVVEAIVEDLTAKTSLFRTLETIVSENAILATNTSSLSVTALASGCSHPERVIGLHFFNPAPLMALVEVVPALQSRPELTEEAMEEMAAWGNLLPKPETHPGSSSTVWHALLQRSPQNFGRRNRHSCRHRRIHACTRVPHGPFD